MAVDSSEVVVGASGKVWVAPAGTAVPIDPTTALAAAYKDVGYLSEDGVSFTGGADVQDINAWQSFYPLRKLITARSAGIEFVMKQWNGENLKAAFGGGTSVTSAGKTFYAPPDPSVQNYQAMVVEWQDGAENYRLVIPRGLASGEVSSQIVRTAAADLPMSFAATPNTSQSTLSTPPTAAELLTQPWYLVTDASSFLT